jgi:hypothetical protein
MRQSDDYMTGFPVEESGRIQIVSADFARTLERELAAANAKAAECEERSNAWGTVWKCCRRHGHGSLLKGETGLMSVCRFIRESREELAAANADRDKANDALADMQAERDNALAECDRQTRLVAELRTERAEAFGALERCIATGEEVDAIAPRLFAGIERLKAERDAEAAKARASVAGMTAARAECDTERTVTHGLQGMLDQQKTYTDNAVASAMACRVASARSWAWGRGVASYR